MHYCVSGEEHELEGVPTSSGEENELIGVPTSREY